MTRQEALAQVAPLIVRINGYQGVAHADAAQLLGQERCERMLRCKIRGLGAVAGYVYPWNVVDYLQFPDLGIA